MDSIGGGGGSSPSFSSGGGGGGAIESSSRPEPAATSSPSPSVESSSPATNTTDSASLSPDAKTPGAGDDDHGVKGLTDGLKDAYGADDKPGDGETPTNSGLSGGAKPEGGAGKPDPNAATKDFQSLADALSKGSPTAAGALEAFQKAGGKFEDGGAAGYFKAGNPPVIGIPTQNRDAAGQRGVMAHELGHYDYNRQGLDRNVPPGPYTGGNSDSQIENRRAYNYVTQNTNNQLNNEVYANQFNARVRDEMVTSGGPTTGVSGIDSGPFRALPSQQQMRDTYSGFTPSTQPNTNYRGYYNDFYQNQYQRLYSPGAPGNQ